MKNLIIIFVMLFGVGTNAFSEEKSNRELKGDKHYFVYSFEKAIDYYVYAKNLTSEGQRRLAKSYNNIDLYIESEVAYSKLLNTGQHVLPEDYYNYARILKINGKVKESNTSMDKFAELKPNDLRVKDYVANKAEFTKYSSDGGKFIIDSLNINSQAEDFAPSFYKDKVVFASSRSAAKMIVRNNNWTGNPFYGLYVSEVEGIQLKKPVIFDKGLNGKMHDGPASFSKDGNFMAFTKNNYDVERREKVVSLQIYFSTFVDDKWSKPEPFVMNSADYSVGHPSLTADGNTMYFTSDMPGGFGGADIYKVIKHENGVWGSPENMGDKVNTEGDEMFPFIHEKSKKLYFASNGRFGLGGLDIFICEFEGSEISDVYNAGAPLNTQHDDYAVIVNESGSNGYFSSNRTGGFGSDDIYAVELLEDIEIQKEIKGIAFDQNRKNVPAVFITLTDDHGNVIDTLTTNENGAYSFSVETNRNYNLTGDKEKYSTGTSTASTFSNDDIITANVKLMEDLEGEVASSLPDHKTNEHDSTTSDPVGEIKKGDNLAKTLAFNPETIYFDYNKFNIRKDAQADMDEIIKVMNENPTMIIELGSHTDCRASYKYNQVLSDKRAAASVNYIRKGITNPERISGKGYGKTKLVNDCPCGGEVVSNCSVKAHQNNRRTEFVIMNEILVGKE